MTITKEVLINLKEREFYVIHNDDTFDCFDCFVQRIGNRWYINGLLAVGIEYMEFDRMIKGCYSIVKVAEMVKFWEDYSLW